MDKDLIFITFYLLLVSIILNVPSFDASLIRILLGIVFVIFVPGYSMMAALFPGKYQLSGVDRVTFSFGLSIAVLPTLGLIIEYSPWKLNFLPLFLSLFILTTVSCIVAYSQRKKLPKDERFELKHDLFAGARMRIYALFLLIGISAFLIINSYAASSSESKLTEFYILNSTGGVENLTKQSTVGSPIELIIGVANHESVLTAYELRVMMDGEMLGKELTELEDGEKWEKKIVVTPQTPGANKKLEFILLKAGDEGPYRSAYLIVDIEEEEYER